MTFTFKGNLITCTPQEFSELIKLGIFDNEAADHINSKSNIITYCGNNVDAIKELCDDALEIKTKKVRGIELKELYIKSKNGLLKIEIGDDVFKDSKGCFSVIRNKSKGLASLI